jgi:uncharacterized protein YjeT (DUF2065 family)
MTQKNRIYVYETVCSVKHFIRTGLFTPPSGNLFRTLRSAKKIHRLIVKGIRICYYGHPKEWFMKFFLCVIGMVFIIEGLPYFVFPERLKAYLAKMSEAPDTSLRIMGLAAIIAGLILVYFGRTE